MRDRVDRLKVYLLGSAVFLMLVIAGYVVHARFIALRNRVKIPANLGVNIVRESGGWTMCRSDGPRTLYCIHAVKADQVKSGKVALHDVSIVLYGKKGDRRDRIYGQDFEYDEKAGVVRALGLVHIDLRVADTAGKDGKPVGEGVASDADKGLPEGSHAKTLDPKLLHVTTSGLVYLEKLGVAATSEPIEFESGTITGHATGADYSSDSGMLLLHSAVSMSGVESGRPVMLNAASAQFDERNQEAHLTKAKYSSETRTAEADQATLFRRPNGTLARVEAEGNVALRENGAAVVSQRADVQLTAASQVQQVLLSGGVLYTDSEPLRQARGQAREATITFDRQAKAQPQHAVFTGGVHMIERTRASENVREPWSVRDLTADKFEAALAPTSKGAQVRLRNAEASGGARLIVVNNGTVASASGAGRTELAADDLRAVLVAASNFKQAPQLDTIAGRGHTVLHQMMSNGVDQTSTGDTLDAKFRPAPAGARSGNAGTKTGKGNQTARPQSDFGADRLWSSVQQGHVTIARRTPAKKEGGRDDVQNASAERAAYDGDSNRLTLRGGVKLMESGSVVWANQVALDRATGDALAMGSVKVNYDSSQGSSEKGGGTRSPAGAGNRSRQAEEPTHILADRAELEHTTDTATFYGKPVRLWQGASQIQAPVVEVSRAQKLLIARGNGETAQVHTLLASAENDLAGAGTDRVSKDVRCETAKAGAGKANTGTAGASQVVRITSGRLLYSGISRQIDFTGGVRADTVDATIRAVQATGYLKQGGMAPQPAEGAAVPSLAGSLERVVASGHVDVAKPGLQATGDRLVYTASDRAFLLMGNQDAAAKTIDAQGTTTAAALRLQNSCDGGVSVEALGEVPGVPAQRVRTEARIRGDQKKEKAK
jgi:lipopolysaccharide export system protein LptA